MVGPLERRHLVLTLVLLSALFLAVGLFGFIFEGEIAFLTQQIANLFGFTGLALLLLVSDSVISPLPPDLILIVIAKSDWREHWYIYVPILGAISTLAGIVGWTIGHFLARTKVAPQVLVNIALQERERVQKFGAWAVFLGAITPLPYSATCWTAGFLGLDFKKFLLVNLARFPRIVIYYLVIHNSRFLMMWFQ